MIVNIYDDKKSYIHLIYGFIANIHLPLFTSIYILYQLIDHILSKESEKDFKGDFIEYLIPVAIVTITKEVMLWFV